MSIESEEFLGKPISAKLSDYLRTYTDSSDMADVSIKTNVGTSSIRYVLYRSNSLTKKSSKAIIELMKIAVRNCTNRIRNAEDAKDDLQTMLK